MAEARRKTRFRRAVLRAGLSGGLLILAIVVTSCGGGASDEAGVTSTTTQQATSGITRGTEAVPTTEPRATTSSAAGQNATIDQDSASGADSEADTSSNVVLSDFSLVYAEDLGGTSHYGEELYVLVGASAGSEDEAQLLLEEAIPRFGDMQSYFIVQHSDNFRGLGAGSWLVIEAYREKPAQENVEFARRGFPKAETKTAIVLTMDPIPVYEDLMGL